VAVRAERALLAVAVYAQQLESRLDQLERRLDQREELDILRYPTLDDLLDVRLHSARVAAELTRVTVELRAEIDDVANRTTPKLTDEEQRAILLATSVLEMSDPMDTSPIDLEGPPGRWAATA
jgi:hypothetical protein